MSDDVRELWESGDIDPPGRHRGRRAFKEGARFACAHPLDSRLSSSVSASRVVLLEQKGGSFEKRWRPGGPKFRPNGSLDSRPGDAVPSYSLLQRPTGPRRGPASPMGVPTLPPEIMCFRWLRQVAQ